MKKTFIHFIAFSVGSFIGHQFTGNLLASVAIPILLTIGFGLATYLHQKESKA